MAAQGLICQRQKHRQVFIGGCCKSKRITSISFHCCQSTGWWQYTIVAFLAWTPRELFSVSCLLCCQLSFKNNRFLLKWRRLPTTFEYGGCQGLGGLKFYFLNKMCSNFHAFCPIWWFIFAINSFNTTSSMQLAGQMESVAETWHIQEVTVIWGN